MIMSLFLSQNKKCFIITFIRKQILYLRNLFQRINRSGRGRRPLTKIEFQGDIIPFLSFLLTRGGGRWIRQCERLRTIPDVHFIQNKFFFQTSFETFGLEFNFVFLFTLNLDQQKIREKVSYSFIKIKYEFNSVYSRFIDKSVNE
jgi:hypothetical protein